jgi:lipopolysaccharide/colanic/teichoic acid biosynthesis glycosyltransferase
MRATQYAEERLASSVVANDTQRIIDTEPLEALRIHKPSQLYFLTKRCIDISLSIFGIIILMPIFLLIALCIKLDDGGSVLYFREIIGEKGRRFYALKFRTMIPDADLYLAERPELLRQFQKNMKLMNDPRVTRMGKFLRKTSMDELPQLFNVLIGQMSLVGPRIIHPSELHRFGQYEQKRLSVRPGITGLWQISGRQHICYDERVQLDMQYIDTRSLLFDFIILIKTFKVIVVQTGV